MSKRSSEAPPCTRQLLCMYIVEADCCTRATPMGREDSQAGWLFTTRSRHSSLAHRKHLKFAQETHCCVDWRCISKSPMFFWVQHTHTLPPRLFVSSDLWLLRVRTWLDATQTQPTTAAEDAAKVEGAEDGRRHGRWQGSQEGQCTCWTE